MRDAINSHNARSDASASPRRRPRDADARRGLIQLALKRRAQWLEDGRLEKIGPRHYRLHLD